jgi:hypothetical protein
MAFNEIAHGTKTVVAHAGLVVVCRLDEIALTAVRRYQRA